MTRVNYAILLLVALAFAIAGCGGGDDGDDGPGPGAYGMGTVKETTEVEKEPPKKGSWGVVFGAEGDQGVILYDLAGHTLYAFDKDEGGESTCYGACAETWPPALSEGKARAGGSALPRKVGTTKRRNGTIQLTYAGRPLYRYSRDEQVAVRGDGIESFGGEWHAMRPNGEEL